MTEGRGAGRALLMRGVGVLLAAVLALAVATLRVVYEGEMELAASSAALLSGDPHEAAVRARRAAAWYAPGAPHVEVAYARLAALATEAEAVQRVDIALLCWRGVRSAAMESRWIWTPHQRELDRANAEIARLESRLPRTGELAAEANETIERAWLARLAAGSTPSRTWTVVLVGSFATWAVGLVLVLWRATDAAGRVAWRRAASGIALTCAGVAGWVTALLAA